MVKNLIGFGVLGVFLAIAPFSQAAEVSADSKIASVTVYPGQALVTRTAKVELEPGIHQVVFKDIIPEVDENTLRVAGSGTGAFKILGAQVKRLYTAEAASAEVRDLEAKVRTAEREAQAIADSLQVLATERDFLNEALSFSRQQLPKDMVTKVPAVNELSGLVGYLRTSFETNLSGARDLQAKMEEKQKEIEALRRQLGELARPDKVRRSIVVDVEAAKAGRLDLFVSYVVNGASWQPIYEARTALDKNAVELVLFALVRQGTGEPWTGVDMTLSTARPSVGGRMPEAEPWLLRPYQPPAVAAKRERVMMGMTKRKASEEDSSYLMNEMAVPASIPVEAEMAYGTVEAKGLSVTYKIPRKATVPTDGTDQRLPVTSQTLKADFRYAAFPRAIPSSYLRGHVMNDADTQLLAGRVNVFLEGEFIGPSSLDAIAPGEAFELSLGADENVRVKREVVEKKVDDVLIGGIPASTIKVTTRIKITVENFKAKSVSFELFEAMPVSQDERIKARVEKVSPEPVQKDWKDKKGVWRWDLTLDPKAKREIVYTAVIEYPRGMIVEGL